MTTKPRKLPASLHADWARRARLAAQIKDLEKTLAGLQKEKKELEAKIMQTTKLQDGGLRLLPDGSTLDVKRIEVAPAIIERAGYVSYRWSVHVPEPDSSETVE